MHLNNGLDIPPRNPDILETSILEILRTYNASMWLPGPAQFVGNYEDSLGQTPLSTVNGLVGYVTDEESDGEAENYVYNTNFSGFTLGGVPAAPYSRHNSIGIVSNVVALGTEDGVPYVDIRMSGTSTNPTAIDCILLEPSQSLVKMPAVVGSIVSGSVYMKFLKIAEPISRVIRTELTERSSAGGFLTTTTRIIDPTTTTEKTRISTTRLTTTSNCDHITFALRLVGVLLGDVVDFTVRLYQFQINKGNLAPFAENTTGAALVRTSLYIPAYQATTGFKPRLVGGFLSYVANGHNIPHPNWGASNGTKTEGVYYPEYGTSAYFTDNDTVSQHFISQATNSGVLPPDNSSNFVTALVKSISGNPVIRVQSQRKNGTSSYVTIDLSNGIQVNQGNTLSRSIVKEKYGFWRVNFEMDVLTGASYPNVVILTQNALSQAGDGTVIEVVNLYRADSADVYQVAPRNTAINQTVDTVPYAWRFDGVDDRLVVEKPTIPDGNVAHFRIVCFKIPLDTAVGADLLIAGTNSAAASSRLAQLGLSSGASIQASWTDNTGVGASPGAIIRTLGEKVVAVMYKTAAGQFCKVHGNMAVPVLLSTAVALGTCTADRERIGCHFPTSEANFFTGDIYGIISGTGEPTLAEHNVMVNFLAGCAGFTPLV